MKPLINVYIIGDNHFNHWNINKYCNRKFKSLEEMNNIMINNWNKTIREKDLIINLGDMIFTKGKSEEIFKIIKQLKGRKILVSGNHDRKSYSWYLTHGIDFICERFVWYYNNKKILFIHNLHKARLCDLKNFDYIIHGHTHNKGRTIHRRKNCKIINVSVEQINYTPLLLVSLLHRVR